jgi:L-alanine-DL-glutamate epimerase-like enolase superfamily enzyme
MTAEGYKETMIIQAIEPLALRIPAASKGSALHLMLCRVRTSDGVEGFGECLCNRPPMQQALLATIRDAIAPLYVGKSVDTRQVLNLDVRRRFASFGRSGTVLNALAAVDTALWDIAGKIAGRSLADMVGGAKRNVVPVMASLDRYGHAGQARARVEQALAAGVAAVKVHEADLAVIEEARRPVEPPMPFIADVNNAHTMADIHSDLRRWQALNLLWLEDPVWPPEDMLACTPLPSVPVALGADLGSAEQLALYARSPAVNFIQPDVCMLGGVSEMLKVVAAEPRQGLAFAPHTPFIGPAALASLQLIAAMPGSAFFATIEADDGMDLFGIGLQRWQKSIAVPTGPGLGHDPDPTLLARYAI